MEEGALKPLKELLKSPSSEIRLNVVQLMANAGEHPAIRAELQACLSELKQMQASDVEPIPRFAQIAIAVITWIP